jgi:hypothetical protein
MRRPRCRSEGSTSTLCHQLRDIVVKIAASVGVELRQIYLPGRCSHHPNNAPQQTSPNPNYRTEEWDPPPSYRRSGKRRERGPTPTLEIWGFGNCVTVARR